MADPRDLCVSATLHPMLVSQYKDPFDFSKLWMRAFMPAKPLAYKI